MTTEIQYPYAVFSDCHFHEWSFGSYINASGVNSRLQHTFDAVEEMCVKLETVGGRDVVFTGDMFHKRGQVTPAVINGAYELFKRLCAKGFRFHTIPGNHDLSTVDSTSMGNAFHSLGEINGFNIYEIPSRVGNFIFIPWFESPYYSIASMDELIDGMNRLTVFCHLGLSAVVEGVGDTIPPSKFDAKEIKNVFAGHFHQHKRFSFMFTDVYSVGALTHQSFRDVDSLAGFLIVSKGVDRDIVEHFETSAPKFMDLNETPILDLFDRPGDCRGTSLEEYKHSFVRILSNVGFSREEIAIVKSTLQAIGALRVVAQPRTFEDTDSLKSIDSDGAKRFIYNNNEKITEGIFKYIKSKYEENLANLAIKTLKEEDFELD